MPITFNVISRKNPQSPNDPPKFYADIVGNGQTTLEDLARYASTVSTVSKADILQAGGSSEGKDTAEEVSSSSIRSVKTIFRPGKMIKDALKLAEFKKKA